MSDKVFYITTPIYYINDIPHIGNASTTVAADVLARFKRLQGREVFFLTGTDEHALKVKEAAEARGVEIHTYVDGIVAEFKHMWERMHITNDDFIRTTEARHKDVVQAAFTKLLVTGDIYKGAYKGWYCVSDETFFRESEVTDGLCPNPECKKPVRWVEEENYFFRLSAYSERILEYINQHPGFLGPEFRKNEVVSFIKTGLRDACVTRKAFGWGIEVPDDPDQVIYVWFDALLNYIAAVGWLSDTDRFARTWPCDVQLMGKDIFVRFHSTLWPAMLMALGLPLPEKIFGHGFWTINGQKIGKSLGNAINPITLAEELAAISGADVDIAMDAIRYFMLREITFGLDGDFSVPGLMGRFNSDLANDLGNLLNRTLPLLHRNRGGIIPQSEDGSPEVEEIRALVKSAADDAAGFMDNLQFNEVLNTIWGVISRANKFMEAQAPWKLVKDESLAGKLDTVLYTVLESVRSIAIMISPFMPVVAERIWSQLGIAEPLSDQRWSDAGTWGLLKPGTQAGEPVPIFPRIDLKAVQASAQSKPEPKKETKMEMEPEKTVDYLSFDDFKKLDLRIAKILTAEKVEGADKLLRLTVDIGTEERQVVAGIAKWYNPEDLVGRQVVMIANLAPAKIRGVESNGMLLAADLDGAAVLLQPDKEVPEGSTVR